MSVLEFQRLSTKKLAASKRGGEAKHRQRLERMQKIREQSLKDITHITKRELWLIGVALYWAEGSKEKECRLGSGVKFGNTDPRMIKIFIKWLVEICSISKDQIGIEIMIHENSVNRVDTVKKYWADATGFPIEKINRIYFKKTHIKTNRKNIGNLYYRGVRVTVKASSSLLRQITGWTEAIVQSIK